MPNVVRIPVAAGAFDPSDITLTDDTSGALLIKEGSNEYMRIDTTNTQEKTIFKTQSGANTGFFVNTPIVGDALSIIRGGSPATFIRLNAGTTLFQVDSDQILADLISDPRTFKVDGTSVSPLVITGDSNTTFTLDSVGSNYFTVKNDASASHIFRINGTNRHTEIERIGYAGTQYIGYSGNYIQRTQPACIDFVTHATGPSTLAVPDMNGSPGSGTFNLINKRTAIRIHSASQSASGDLFTATLNVSDNLDELIREMFLYVSNYDSTNNFALKIQASAGSGNWRELNSSGITGVSGQTIDAATTYVYRIFQYAPGATAATRVYGIYFMGKMAH
jgi:hypothetical protein